MKSRGYLLTIAVVALPGLATAQINNPGFEDATNFHFWSTFGDNQIEGSSLGSGPIEGSKQALLATATDGTVNANVVAGTGATEAQVEAGLGLSANTLSSHFGSNIVLASGISQSITLAAGQHVTFSWDFLTNQTYNDGTPDSIAPNSKWNDFSFVSLSLGSNQQVLKLADTFYGYINNPNLPGGFGTGFTLTNASNPFISETGYQTFTITAATSGTYTLGVGVAHEVLAGNPDDGVNSALLVDNFVVTPEPASFVGLGLLAAVCVRRRRVRK